jgi:hypothetical protein
MTKNSEKTKIPSDIWEYLTIPVMEITSPGITRSTIYPMHSISTVRGTRPASPVVANFSCSRIRCISIETVLLDSRSATNALDLQPAVAHLPGTEYRPSSKCLTCLFPHCVHRKSICVISDFTDDIRTTVPRTVTNLPIDLNSFFNNKRIYQYQSFVL